MTLAQLLIPLAILFSVSLVFFGMSDWHHETAPPKFNLQFIK